MTATILSESKGNAVNRCAVCGCVVQSWASDVECQWCDGSVSAARAILASLVMHCLENEEVDPDILTKEGVQQVDEQIAETAERLFSVGYKTESIVIDLYREQRRAYYEARQAWRAAQRLHELAVGKVEAVMGRVHRGYQVRMHGESGR